MTFVKLYLYANHLIGNTSVPLLDLTNVCNREGYKATPVQGRKTNKLQSTHLKTALEGSKVKNLFRLSSDEDGKASVGLTDHGIRQVTSLAQTFNSFVPEEPHGRLREVLMIFKKEGLLQERETVSIKKLGKLCEKNGYKVQNTHLKTLLSAGFARQFFVFDKEREVVRLSPVGIKMIESLT